MKVIATYIPTEVLTLYLAVVAAVETPGQLTDDQMTLLMAFYTPAGASFLTFLLLTPAIVWLVYATRVKASQRHLPVHPTEWPVWEMFASTAAYLAWAFALPANPFSQLPWYSSSVAGIVVLATSMLLGLLSPLLMRPIEAGGNQPTSVPVTSP